MPGPHSRESVIEQVRRSRVEEASPQMSRLDDHSTRGDSGRVQLHTRLVAGESLRAYCWSGDEASMGPELDYRGPFGFRRLHGLLHPIQVLYQGLGCLQEVRKRHIETA